MSDIIAFEVACEFVECDKVKQASKTEISRVKYPSISIKPFLNLADSSFRKKGIWVFS